jgi:hypothetical protein
VVRIHEEKLSVNNAPATKDDISSLRREIMNTQSALKMHHLLYSNGAVIYDRVLFSLCNNCPDQ